MPGQKSGEDKENSIFNKQTKPKSFIDKYEHLLQDGSLPDKHREFLFSQFCSLRPAGFRILPKLHKTPVQIRPIVRSKQFCLSPSSNFLDEHLKNILSGLPYVLKNSTALLESLNNLLIDQSCILVTGDVKSLYTDISVQDAIVVVDSICREFKIRETPLLIEMLRLVLTNNFSYCSELDKIFLQIWGLATGTPAAEVISQIYTF